MEHIWGEHNVLGITGKLYHPTGSAYSTDNEFNNYTNYVEMLDN